MTEPAALPGWVSFRGHGGDEVRGWFARPPIDEQAVARADDARLPALVLVQEVFGIDAHIRALVERFARAGFVVLAPDLFAREGLPQPRAVREGLARAGDAVWTKDDIRSAVASLPDRRVLGDLEGALAHLARDARVDRERMGAVGFCMGGNYAYMLGCTSRALACVVDFYGRFIYAELGPNKPIQPLERALNLSVPLLALFGDEDPSITPADVERMRQVLTQFARDFRIVTFPGVGHGFMNDRRKSYDERAAREAWGIAIDFLREHLVPS